MVQEASESRAISSKQAQSSGLPLIFLLPPIAIASASLFFPLPSAPPDPAFVRAHPSKGLTFFPFRPYWTATTGSGGSSGEESSAPLFVADLVAGGVEGEKADGLTGVLMGC